MISKLQHLLDLVNNSNLSTEDLISLLGEIKTLMKILKGEGEFSDKFLSSLSGEKSMRSKIGDVVLKDCPFCGGLARMFGDSYTNSCFIRCLNCYATGRMLYETDESKAKVVEDWNTRVRPNSLQVLQAVINRIIKRVDKMKKVDKGKVLDQLDEILYALESHCKEYL